MSSLLQEMPDEIPAASLTPEEIAFEAALEARFSAALRALRETLATHGLERLILIRETTLGDPLEAAIAASGLPVENLELRNSEGLRQFVQLVDIDAESRRERLVNQTVRLALQEALQSAIPTQRARSVAAWLITDEPLSKIREAFEQRSRYPTSPLEHHILRFWDPRVTQHIGALFARKAHALPTSWLPGTVWLYVDSFAELKVLPAPEGTGTLEMLPDIETLTRVSLITLTLQYLAENGLRHDKSILPAVAESVEIARAQKLPDEEDTACFAAHRVFYARPLEKAPRMQDILANVREEGSSYQNITADFEDEDWDAIVQASTPQDQ
jgi:hypothetical protein